ncbi:Putative expansin-A30 [Triticum urartu]|uniref:Putative expansin-A30 n=1 Tax=Triticum urartu TaxID=4572 RepID=M7Z7K5_TRIUA|nr:Putative expansin-A30 [Triticum urartu]
MASAASKSAAVLVLLVSLAGGATTVDARFRAMQWTPAHATFYGDEATAETMGGACGYDITAGYGADTAALSSTLFLDGYGCGTCYQIRCVKATACYRGSPAFGQLGGQALSFKLTSYTTGLTIIAADATPASWSIGLTYQARANFK